MCTEFDGSNDSCSWYFAMKCHTFTAPPMISEDTLADVGDILGVASVEVSLIIILSCGIPKVSAAICRKVKVWGLMYLSTPNTLCS